MLNANHWLDIIITLARILKLQSFLICQRKCNYAVTWLKNVEPANLCQGKCFSVNWTEKRLICQPLQLITLASVKRTVLQWTPLSPPQSPEPIHVGLMYHGPKTEQGELGLIMHYPFKSFERLPTLQTVVSKCLRHLHSHGLRASNW